MKNNVEIILRERGKIVSQTESHNVWTVAGSGWIARLISEGLENNRIRYVGFGIGGVRQSCATAFQPPMTTEYPGTNNQSIMTPDIKGLERPCAVHKGAFLKEITEVDLCHSKLHHHTGTKRRVGLMMTKFTTIFDMGDLSYDNGDFKQIPLSEIGLFAAGTTSPLGYNTFPTVLKSNTHEMTVVWTVRL